MVTTALQFDRQQLAEVCQRHHIRKVSLFGSALRDDFCDNSDVDLLVEFDAQFPVGLRIVQIEDELSAVFGNRKVDIVNPKYLNRRLSDEILSSAVLQYEA